KVPEASLSAIDQAIRFSGARELEVRILAARRISCMTETRGEATRINKTGAARAAPCRDGSATADTGAACTRCRPARAAHWHEVAGEEGARAQRQSQAADASGGAVRGARGVRSRRVDDACAGRRATGRGVGDRQRRPEETAGV